MFSILLLASTLSCPTVQPGPTWVCQDGGWLPPGHPAIRVVEPPTLPSWCTPFPNPYEDGDAAATCAALMHPLPVHQLTFKVGARYRHAYASQLLVVTELKLDTFGAIQVTGRWVEHSDPDQVSKVFTFTAGKEPFTEAR